MKGQTPQNTPQNDRKSTANYTAEGDMKVVNNYYRDDSPAVVVFDFGDVLGIAFFVAGVLFLCGVIGWGLYEIGLKIVALWGWVAANWRYIAIGFVACFLFAAVTFWYVVTYTTDEPDSDLL